MIRIWLERFFELPIIPAQAELEGALRDVDESLFAEGLFGARSRVRHASRGFDERHAQFRVMGKLLFFTFREGRRDDASRCFACDLRAWK